MPETDTFSVAVAQRRLVEAICDYGWQLQANPIPDAQQQVQNHLAKGVLVSAEAAQTVDPEAAKVFAALAELISSVVIERKAAEHGHT